MKDLLHRVFVEACEDKLFASALIIALLGVLWSWAYLAQHVIAWVRHA